MNRNSRLMGAVSVRCAVVLVVAVLLTSANASLAQSYPDKPIRIVVTFPAGGPTDAVARPISQSLSSTWGQPVIIDNRGGAGGIVGTEIVAHSAPDGYNLLIGTAGGMSINPSLHAKLSYDPFKDFAPISMLVINPQILVMHPALAASNVRELVALAKSKPGQLNFASSGTGTATHLGLELFKAATGINVVHVPYKGGAPALTDLIAGQVQLLFISIPSVMPQVKAGRLKAIAVSSARRSLSAPEVPTVAESGYPGFEYVNWNALFAPAATPRAIINKLNSEVVKIMRDPDLAQKLVSQGAEPAPGTPEQLAQYMRVDFDRWRKVIRAAGITAN